jgi:acid phosphatase family membrane protein YuiD
MVFEHSESILGQWVQNRFFFAAFWSWAIAQTVKVLLGIMRERRFNFKWFVGSGGMPSSHAALVAGLTTSIGLDNGFDSALFALAFAVMVITMFDAQGVRRRSGQQAEALNKIMDDLYMNKGVQEERLKELFGHTPVEVFAGGLVGIVVSLLFYR